MPLTDGRDDDNRVEQRSGEGPLHLARVLVAVPAVHFHRIEDILLENLGVCIYRRVQGESNAPG